MTDGHISALLMEMAADLDDYDRRAIRLSSWQNSSRWFRIDRFRIVNMEIEMLFSRWFLWITFHRCLWTIALLLIISPGSSMAENATHRFKIVVLAEAGGIHRPFVDAAKVWLDKQAAGYNFSVDYIQDTAKIDDAFLSRYQVFIQLNYPPYGWAPTAMAAFTKYIEEGRGGWIGFHHATLLGEFDGYPMWPWFSQFMGGIRFTDYIPKFATATVLVEDPSHPVMKDVGKSFVVDQEEWYTYDKSPRPNVHVLARVDEASYSPDTRTKMGDHPVVWTTEHYKARNLYIFMGHHPELFQNPAFTTIFRNSILWAARQ